MPAEDTYYDLLDVKLDASAAEIRSAYRRRIKQTHPDQGGDAVLFRRVQRAFETLSDPVLRRIYDEEIAPPGPSRSQRPPGSVEDLFGPGSSWQETGRAATSEARHQRQDDDWLGRWDDPVSSPVRRPLPLEHSGATRASRLQGSWLARFGLPVLGLAILWSGGGASALPELGGARPGRMAGFLAGIAGAGLAIGLEAVRLRLGRTRHLGVMSSVLGLGLVLGGVLLELSALESGLSLTMLGVGVGITAWAARPLAVRRQLLGLDPVNGMPRSKRTMDRTPAPRR